MDNLYLFEIMNDHPDNIKRINDTLHDIKNTLFDHLYVAQRALSLFHRVDIDFASYRPLRHNRIVFDINHTYIENEDRCDFRRSKYYKREILCDDIFRNPDIFSKGIFVFINGELVNNFYVFFSESRLEIRFARYFAVGGVSNDGMHRNIIDEYANNHATVSVVIMPICKKAIGEIPYNRLHSDNLTVSTYANYLMGTSYVDVGTTPMLFIAGSVIGYGGSGPAYRAIAYDRVGDLLSIKGATYEPTLYTMYDPTMYINIVYPANLIASKTVASDGWFSLPIMRMPIPKENILVFKKSTNPNDSEMVLDYSAKIDMYYPNVYRILSDHDGEFFIYAFYDDSIKDSELIHYNELKIYTRFMDGLPEYIDNTVPEYIKTYEPIEMRYSIDDYKDTEEGTLEYKIRKLREVIYENPELYSYYMRRYTEMYPNVFLEMSADEYNSRLRNDTSTELPNMDVVTFDAPRYMFSVKRENNLQFFKFYIDRKAYYPTKDEMFYDNQYLYIYVSTDIVKIDSIIEVQKMYDSTMSKEYTVDTSAPLRVELDPHCRATVEDIYITHNNGTIEEYIVNYTVYEKLSADRMAMDIDIEIAGERYRPLDDTSFYKYPEIYIVFDDDSLNGEVVTIRSDKRTMVYDEFGGEFKAEITDNVNTDKRNYLIYSDGRLMSPLGIKLRFNDDSNGPHTVQALIATEADTIVVASHMPDKYKLVCDYADDYVKRLRIYQKYMDDDELIYGREGNVYDKQLESSVELENRINEIGHFVDLTNLISKPLDFRWYEIYMNGLKLTDKDVIFISPYQMIITLQDDYPDIDTFIITDLIGFIRKYVIPLPFINPDWVQVTDEMIDEYPEVMDRNTNVVFDSDTLYTMTGSVLLNPDLSEGYSIHDPHE